jgi:hypothetical protein
MERANGEDKKWMCKVKDGMQPDQRRLEQSQDGRVWHEDLRERLNRWKNVCVMCHGRGENSAHTINRCPLEEDSMKVESESGRMCKRRSSSRNHTYVSSAACRV